jgi:hypothetical protein
VDEAVSEDGVADLLVELVQRLHLVRRDCTLLSEVSSRRKARQNLLVLYYNAGAGNAC